MEQRLKESLSALLDGEADELELHRILALSDEAELRALWSRYHRVRTVMSTADTGLHQFDISASVAAAIASGDDAVVAPVQKPALRSVVSAATPVPSVAPAMGRFWKLTGVAASVAVAFVVGLSFQASGPDAQSVTSNQIASVTPRNTVEWPAAQKPSPAPSRAETLYVSGLGPDQLDRLPKLSEQLSEAHAKRFNGYLLRHAEHAALSGRQGMVPLARVASFNSVGLSGSGMER